MITKRHRQLGYAALIALAILSACFWSEGYLASSRQAAEDALRQLEICRTSATRIEQLKHRSDGAGDGVPNQVDLQGRCQEALARAGISADHLMEIAPETPQSVGQSAYKQIRSRVVLRDVTLRQLVAVLLAATGGRPTLQVSSLWVHAPHDGADGPQWSVETTLFYLIYDPSTTVKVVDASVKDERS